ncbi:hypothetical protein [Pseudomonas sp. CF150]|uniref:hypothetical protein n=1 Tax=Pseudomonas sp. CF150 TaxID=911240 RepID=UPI0012EBF372|nr:hypothetical protein [Pseudomonas sp. CF150]
MSEKSLTIFVEGKVDKVIVENILVSAGFELNRITVFVCEGKYGVKKSIRHLKNSSTQNFIALVDSDELSVVDSRVLAAEQLGYPTIQVFCAVPAIESWLFSDDNIAIEAASTRYAKSILSRAPLPELIPYPKHLAANVFNLKSDRAYEFVKYIDVYRASTRSASLRAFILGVSEALEHPIDLPLSSLSSSVTRDVFSTLLRELPSDTVAWRTLEGGALQADKLAKEIAEGTETGKRYVTEVLRVARDLVARRSR